MHQAPWRFRNVLALLTMLAVVVLTGLVPVASASAAGCTIPQSDVATALTNTSGTIDQTSAWDQFQLEVQLTNLDGLQAGCIATVQLDPQHFGGMRDGQLYLNADGTSSTSSRPDTVATMTVDAASNTLTFTLTDYASSHVNVTAHGYVTAQINTNIERGETTPVDVSVNGVTHDVPVTGAECTDDCPDVPTDAGKWGTVAEDGSGSVTITSPVVPRAGTEVQLYDSLTSPGQTITGVEGAWGYNCVDTWGEHGVRRADGTCDTSASLPVQVTETGGHDTFTTTEPGEFVTVRLGMRFDIDQYDTWTDSARLVIDGHEYTATTKVAKYDMGGGAAGEDQPTPHVEKVTLRFQVDTYTWHGSVRYGRKIARLDNDGRLTYREDAFMWNTLDGQQHTDSVWQIVKVRVAKDATPQQIMRAVNRAATKDGIGRLRSTRKLTATGSAHGRATVAWKLGPRSWPIGGRAPQGFFASSVR